MDGLLANLGTGNRYFAQLDLEAAYHQVPLVENSWSLITVITHIGTYKFTRMSVGIKSRPSVFQRIMSELLGDCRGMLVYLDDILVAAPEKNTLQKRVQLVRGKLKDVDIKINEKKLIDCSQRVTQLGLEISEDGK